MGKFKVAEFGRLIVVFVRGCVLQVGFAVREEMARTVADFLSLRTRLAFVNTEAALEAAPRVAELMQAAHSPPLLLDRFKTAALSTAFIR